MVYAVLYVLATSLSPRNPKEIALAVLGFDLNSYRPIFFSSKLLHNSVIFSIYCLFGAVLGFFLGVFIFRKFIFWIV